MQFIAVIVAAAASFALGAVWYMRLSKPWIKAAGIKVDAEGRPQGNGSPMPFVIGFIAAVLVAGMMRHVFVEAEITTLGKGLMSGLGIGAFFITPWTAMNNAYAMRPMLLTAIDGGYAILACGVMGLVLTLFL